MSIRRLIKHIADKQGAHLDTTSSPWIRMSNDGMSISTIFVFASEMIYAATVQIKELEDYYLVKPMMETL